jgi:hypothetical protein
MVTLAITQKKQASSEVLKLNLITPDKANGSWSGLFL